MNSAKRCFALKRRVLFERQIGTNTLETPIGTSSLRSAVEIDNCFKTRSETLTYQNQIVFIYFGHFNSYGGLQRCYFQRVMEALYVVVQYVEIVTHSFFGRLDLMMIAEILVLGCTILCLLSCSLSRVSQISSTSYSKQY